MPHKTIEIPELSKSDIDRFWAKVDKTSGQGPNGDCWQWTASKDDGYGKFGAQRKLLRATRIAYFLCKRPIPEGLLILHSCDNRPCCNPAHLYPGTHGRNMRDRDQKGRQAHGVRSGLAKLNRKKVLEIKKKYIPWKYSYQKLAKEYGVHEKAIYNIIKGKGWTHISE